MTEKWPEEIANALTLLDASFGSVGTQDQAQSFKNAVYMLNDCMDEFPIYREDIRRIKYSYAVRLLCGLATSPDYNTWLEYTLLLCIDLKKEMKILKFSDPQLFESFLAFLRLYENDVPQTFRANIARFIEEITQ